MDVVGFGWIWLDVVGFDWMWLHLVGFDWMRLDLIEFWLRIQFDQQTMQNDNTPQVIEIYSTSCDNPQFPNTFRHLGRPFLVLQDVLRHCRDLFYKFEIAKFSKLTTPR